MSLVETNFTETATVERYKGQSSLENQYEDPVEVDCEIQHEKSWSRNTSGDVVVANAKMKVSSDLDPIPAQSKVTFNGEEHEVITYRVPRDRLVNEKHHMELDLT